jgi:hypothetical protein
VPHPVTAGSAGLRSVDLRWFYGKLYKIGKIGRQGSKDAFSVKIAEKLRCLKIGIIGKIRALFMSKVKQECVSFRIHE